MKYLTKYSIIEDIKDEMRCQGMELSDLAEHSGISADELSVWMDPAHDLTFDEMHTMLSALDSDIRYEVVPD